MSSFKGAIAVLQLLQDVDIDRLRVHVEAGTLSVFLASDPDSSFDRPYLRLISEGESLTLDATDGAEVLAEANNVFAYIDPDFKDVVDEGPATKEVAVAVYEMREDATFSQMFGSLSENLQKLCFTQAQIKSFAQKHRQWLRSDGYATFFLFKSQNHFFVADVFVGSAGGLGVALRRFGNSGVWRAGHRRRVVVPRLA